jgi:hypothetical protein
VGSGPCASAGNEAVFRAVNERLEDLNRTFGSFSAQMRLMCECADAACNERISVTDVEYATDPRSGG